MLNQPQKWRRLEVYLSPRARPRLPLLTARHVESFFLTHCGLVCPSFVSVTLDKSEFRSQKPFIIWSVVRTVVRSLIHLLRFIALVVTWELPLQWSQQTSAFVVPAPWTSASPELKRKRLSFQQFCKMSVIINVYMYTMYILCTGLYRCYICRHGSRITHMMTHFSHIKQFNLL